VVRLVIDEHPSLAQPTVGAPSAQLGEVPPVLLGGVPPAQPGRHTWSVDFARRHFGPRVTAMPDATAWLHVTGLALLAGGRQSRVELESQLLIIDGDAHLAGSLLDAIAGCASESTAVLA
jgi:hypothetical protein